MDCKFDTKNISVLEPEPLEQHFLPGARALPFFLLGAGVKSQKKCKIITLLKSESVGNVIRKEKIYCFKKEPEPIFFSPGVGAALKKNRSR